MTIGAAQELARYMKSSLVGTNQSRIIWRAFSICALGAGHWILPSSSRTEGDKWYSGMSAFAFLGGDPALVGGALRFIVAYVRITTWERITGVLRENTRGYTVG